MQQNTPDQIPIPEGDETLEPDDKQSGLGDTDDNERNEPLAGETNERDPAWRPGDEPAGEGVYDRSQERSAGVEDEPEGPAVM